MGPGALRRRPWLTKSVGARGASPGRAADPKTLWELAFPPTTAAQDSGDSKMDGRSPLPQGQARNVRRRATGLSSGSPSWGRLFLVAAIFVIHAGLAESIKLSELPSPKCLWIRLPHAVQVAILILMVVLLYGVNRFFDKLDEVSNARLSRAFSGLAEVRKRAANRRTSGQRANPNGQNAPPLAHLQQETQDSAVVVEVQRVILPCR